MAEAKARRWRFVIKAYEPGAVEERPRPAKGPHSFDKALKAGACSMYRRIIEVFVKRRGLCDRRDVTEQYQMSFVCYKTCLNI
jgi:hypothetical protein